MRALGVCGEQEPKSTYPPLKRRCWTCVGRYSGDAYEEGSAYLGAALELEEDVYAESTDEVRTAVAGHASYQFASAAAQPRRLSSGRQGFFTEVSSDMELAALSPTWDDTFELPGREVSQV